MIKALSAYPDFAPFSKTNPIPNLLSLGSATRSNMSTVREANWIDGLRGIAAFVVVLSHINSAVHPEYHFPAMYENGNSILFQKPFLRLIMAGPSALALFFIITGYVSSQKYIIMARRDPEAALKSLSRTALSRPVRLILPSLVGTAISWLLLELGAFKMAREIDAEWIRNGGGTPDPCFPHAVRRLLTAFVKTWTEGWDEFDGIQWPMVLLLESSMTVYLTMLATMYVTPKMRRFLFGAVFLYGWAGGRVLKTSNTLFGMILASVSPTSLTQIPFPIPTILMLTGGFLGSYPQNAPTWAPWSRFLYNFIIPNMPSESMHADFPIDKLYVIDHRRYIHSLAMCCFILGVAASPKVQRFLCSGPIQFMGRVSLPVYLLHNQLLKSVFTWVVYSPAASWQVNPITLRIHPAYQSRYFIAYPVFFAVLYFLAYIWTIKIDPWCDRLVKRFTNFVLTPSEPRKPTLG